MCGCVPAISVPIKLSQHNLPISLQLITNRFNEQTLLNTALFLDLCATFLICLIMFNVIHNITYIICQDLGYLYSISHFLFSILN
ncbi:hypothetical protein EB796_007809 [Bugula neritina]|uniref:Uncharacterized protein n=1 Tax=Bugula neritina TaxID=10212 RepID=A0A7J7K6L4_BUGNE|nr:hypothetical protein EB796_007809 [Bugula neritina]